MLGALTIVFGFMVFMLILTRGRIIFFGVFSFLIIAAISLGVGYGMAVLVVTLFGPLMKTFLILGSIIVLIALVAGKPGGDSDD